MSSTPAAIDTTNPRRQLACLVLAALYVVTLVGANVLTSQLGMVPAGFGLTVTAGTYAAGLAFGVRDGLHDVGGLHAVMVALLLGVGLSAVTANPQIASASAVAALAGELIDLGVYSPLRAHSLVVAVTVSGAVGAVVDTVGFLLLAGFPVSWSAIGGQLLVKAVWMSACYLLVGEGVRRVVSRQRQLARGA